MTFNINDPVDVSPRTSFEPTDDGLRFWDSKFTIGSDFTDGHLNSSQKLLALHDISKGWQGDAFYAQSNPYVKLGALGNGNRFLEFSGAVTDAGTGHLFNTDILHGSPAFTVALLHQKSVVPSGSDRHDILSVSLNDSGSAAPILTLNYSGGTSLTWATSSYDAANSAHDGITSITQGDGTGGSVDWRFAIATVNFAAGTISLERGTASASGSNATTLARSGTTFYAPAPNYKGLIGKRNNNPANLYQGRIHMMPVIPKALLSTDGGEGAALKTWLQAKCAALNAA
ncbi:hypothetical protein QBK99_10950 [Corticibacterium sp. UT-5YL-CI-8]|nr:hypothetical protein [Tianweitania sp. UT-5YL-CI-8]